MGRNTPSSFILFSALFFYQGTPTITESKSWSEIQMTGSENPSLGRSDAADGLIASRSSAASWKDISEFIADAAAADDTMVALPTAEEHQKDTLNSIREEDGAPATGVLRSDRAVDRLRTNGDGGGSSWAEIANRRELTAERTGEVPSRLLSDNKRELAAERTVEASSKSWDQIARRTALSSERTAEAASQSWDEIARRKEVTEKLTADKTAEASSDSWDSPGDPVNFRIKEDSKRMAKKSRTEHQDILESLRAEHEPQMLAPFRTVEGADVEEDQGGSFLRQYNFLYKPAAEDKGGAVEKFRSSSDAVRSDQVIDKKDKENVLNWVISQFQAEDDTMKPEAVRDGPEPSPIEFARSQNTSSAASSASSASSPEAGSVSQILSKTIQQMRQKGLKMDPNAGCGNSEVFLLNKDKMILVSSGNIAHEISGLTKFEDNLLNQINNQEAIIDTLKGRLEAKDKQAGNMQKIVQSFQANQEAGKKELRLTQELLEKARAKLEILQRLNNAESEAATKARNDAAALQTRLAVQEGQINDLKLQLQKANQLPETGLVREDMERCEKELVQERKMRNTLEASMKKIAESGKDGNVSGSGGALLERQLQLQDKTINLTMQQIREQKTTIELLNKIILQKDQLVLGLQDQVKELLEHDQTALKGCTDKDKLIDSQYAALSNMKNLSLCQDKYTQARDTALKILQNTVFEMVEKIPSCKDQAIAGLRDEISALSFSNKPLMSMVTKLQESLQATITIQHQNRNNTTEKSLMTLLKQQKRALASCMEETRSQQLTRDLFKDIAKQRSRSEEPDDNLTGGEGTRPAEARSRKD